MNHLENRQPTGLSRNTLKLIAFVTMFIDHFGMVFFPGAVLWRIIGRISFPIFAYLIADGIQRTRNPARMLFRLFVFAVISQYPYSLALYGRFSLKSLNIFVTLLLGAVTACYLSRDRAKPSSSRMLKDILLVVTPCLLAELVGADYGAYGVLLIALFASIICASGYQWSAEKQRSFIILSLIVLNVFYAAWHGSILQCFSVLSGFWLPHEEKPEMPWRIGAYAIYPLHLLAFGLLAKLF